MILMLFGTVELALVYKDILVLNQSAREGARTASVGNPVATVSSRVGAAAVTVNPAQVNTSCAYRTISNGVWSGWSTLTDSGQTNAAPSGAQIRVTVQYSHPLMTGLLSNQLPNAQNGSVALTSSAIARRE
jgi:Flp pilus assembly protein TadG